MIIPIAPIVFSSILAGLTWYDAHEKKPLPKSFYIGAIFVLYAVVLTLKGSLVPWGVILGTVGSSMSFWAIHVRSKK